MNDAHGVLGIGRTDGARNQVVEELIAASIAVGKCPFCSRVPNVPVFPSSAFMHWRVFYSLSPMEGLSRHIMIVPNQHTLFWHDVIRDARLEYRQIIRKLQDRFGPTYTTLMRLGNPAHNSATIFHLHGHFMVPGGQTPMIPAEHLEWTGRVKHLAPSAIQRLAADLDALRAVELAEDGDRKAWPIRIEAFEGRPEPIGDERDGYGHWLGYVARVGEEIDYAGIGMRLGIVPPDYTYHVRDEAIDALDEMIVEVEKEWPHSLGWIMRHAPGDLHHDLIVGNQLPAVPSGIEVPDLHEDIFQGLKAAAPAGYKGGPLEFVDSVRISLLRAAAQRGGLPTPVQLKLSNWAAPEYR